MGVFVTGDTAFGSTVVNELIERKHGDFGLPCSYRPAAQLPEAGFEAHGGGVANADDGEGRPYWEPRRTPPRIDRNEVRRAVYEYRDTGSQAARDRVVRANLGLAYSLAARFAHRGEELDDLNQVALIGLLKAVDRFNPDRGVELTTFATATILGELKRHLRDRSWSVHLPRGVHDLHFLAQQAIDELTQELGRSPTRDEISTRVGAAAEKVAEALDAGGLRNNVAMEAGMVNGDDQPFTSRLGERDQGLAEAEGRLWITQVLERFPERQRQILNLRFVAGYSQNEIANTVGVGQTQVSSLLARSVAQLQARIGELV